MNIPEVTTHAIILNREKDRILLVKWQDFAGDEVWSFPGGHINLGETIKDALLREVKEETGYKIEITDFLGVYDNIIKDKDVLISHFINIIWITSILYKEDTLKKDVDILDQKWISFNDINKINITKNAANILKDMGINI